MKIEYEGSGDLIKFSAKLLQNVDIERPRYEASLLMSEILKKQIYEILSNPKINIGENERRIFLKKIYQRYLKKPISRIFGKREFYSRDFFINKYVLDPRPESEIIVDLVKSLHSKINGKLISILELGTGSGCLIISILREINNKKTVATATDISIKALEIARKNICQHKLSNRVKLIQSNWFSKINEKFDIIFSNPPYVKTKIIKDLDSSVRDYDPLLSLDGGRKGLDAYKSIAKQAKKHLKNSGFLIFEIGNNQISSVCSIFEKKGFKLFLIKKDLTNKIRTIVFKNKFE